MRFWGREVAREGNSLGARGGGNLGEEEYSEISESPEGRFGAKLTDSDLERLRPGLDPRRGGRRKCCIYKGLRAAPKKAEEILERLRGTCRLLPPSKGGCLRATSEGP
jgi:hypothetical protein